MNPGRFSTTRASLVIAATAVSGSVIHGLVMRRRLAQARRDPLTGAWTRQAWTDRADRRLAGQLVVLVDLDGFKTVNDVHGHAAGDAVLRAVAARLEFWSRYGDGGGDRPGHGLVGRLGGDEFVALLPAVDVDRLTDLREALCRPVCWQGRALRVGASLGAYLAEDETTLPRALAAADAAMYTAKTSGAGVCRADTAGPAGYPMAVAGRLRRHRSPAVRVPRPRRAAA